MNRLSFSHLFFYVLIQNRASYKFTVMSQDPVEV